METIELVKLTNSVYKLTLLFPKKDPLRYRIREAATAFLEEAIFCLKKAGANNQAAREKWEILRGLLELSRRQNWVQQGKIIAIENRYLQVLSGILSGFPVFSKTQSESIMEEETSLSKIVEEKHSREAVFRTASDNKESAANPETIYKIAGSLPVLRPEQAEREFFLNRRQEEVLKIIRDKKEIKIGELSRYFPDKSRRTILRDLDLFLQNGLVSKQGNGRGVFYRLQPKAINVTLSRA